MDGFWNGRNVMVTGASGLLGGWLCEKLVSSGADVTVLLRDRTPASRLLSSGAFDKVNVVHGAAEDYAVVERALNEYGSGCLFHLGAQAIVGTANRSPLGTFESNIRGTWTVLEAARNSELVEAVVFASSDKAYGAGEALPYVESMPLSGRHPYDVSKSCGDLIAQCYHSTYGLPVAIARCANLFGGGDLNFSRLIPGTIRSALRGERPVIRSDGRHVRDYLYVKDAAGAFMLLAEKIRSRGIAGEAFNFSMESRSTVLDTVRLILGRMGSGLEPVIEDSAQCEIREQYLSAEKARNVLGWKAEYSFESGIDETIAWYRSLFNASRR